MAFSFLLYTWIMSPTNPTTLPWNSHCYMLSLGSYSEDKLMTYNTLPWNSQYNLLYFWSYNKDVNKPHHPSLKQPALVLSSPFLYNEDRFMNPTHCPETVNATCCCSHFYTMKMDSWTPPHCPALHAVVHRVIPWKYLIFTYDLVPKGAHARGYALQLKIKHCWKLFLF